MKQILAPLMTLGLLAALVAIPAAASAQEDPGYGHIGPRHVQEGWRNGDRYEGYHYRRNEEREWRSSEHRREEWREREHRREEWREREHRHRERNRNWDRDRDRHMHPDYDRG